MMLIYYGLGLGLGISIYCSGIADALKGTDKIVLVKNPVNPDLALWLGGIERIYIQI